MKKTMTMAAIALAAMTLAPMARATDDPLLAKLKDSKISLLAGIQQAERDSGPTISAKFEIGDDGKLSLSIYTAPKGLQTPAEANPLTELSGSPTGEKFTPSAEVFADKEHIARASVHLTVMQMSKLTLSQIIKKALYVQTGFAYSVVNPMVRDGEPVADVFILNDEGASVRVTVNVQTGYAYLN